MIVTRRDVKTPLIIPLGKEPKNALFKKNVSPGGGETIKWRKLCLCKWLWGSLKFDLVFPDFSMEKPP